MQGALRTGGQNRSGMAGVGQADDPRRTVQRRRQRHGLAEVGGADGQAGSPEGQSGGGEPIRAAHHGHDGNGARQQRAAQAGAGAAGGVAARAVAVRE